MPMDWDILLSARRLNKNNAQETEDQSVARSEFQRDFDRIIFSSPFRRLQNKTQVFPLPGSVFVHNRLTHSLEVASVGRSLGNILSNKLRQNNEASGEKVQGIGSIVSAACLAHDMGNPSFGHSGEKAISKYFKENTKNKDFERWKRSIENPQWSDLTNFEGNANAFRILTNKFKGKGESGFALTYSTLASIVKYPFDSVEGEILYQGEDSIKYGFFQSEKKTYKQIASELGIIKKKNSNNSFIYSRYPLVFLVEAADDICYNIIDIEDAHRLRILSTEKVIELYMPFIKNNNVAEIKRNLKGIEDENDKVAFLRAKCINTLIWECSEAFWKNRSEILSGLFDKSLIKSIPEPYYTALKNIGKVSVKSIYNYKTVAELEIAGYNVLGGLLEEFVPAILSEKKSHYHKKLLTLMSSQFHTDKESTYDKIQSVVDYISGMTDLYAIEMYRKIKGISIPTIK